MIEKQFHELVSEELAQAKAKVDIYITDTLNVKPERLINQLSWPQNLLNEAARVWLLSWIEKWCEQAKAEQKEHYLLFVQDRLNELINAAISQMPLTAHSMVDLTWKIKLKHAWRWRDEVKKHMYAMAYGSDVYCKEGRSDEQHSGAGEQPGQ